MITLNPAFKKLKKKERKIQLIQDQIDAYFLQQDNLSWEERRNRTSQQILEDFEMVRLFHNYLWSKIHKQRLLKQRLLWFQNFTA